MIGLLLIYFIGKAFYKLAELHNKSKWGMAILGVLSYYFGTFLGGVILALGYEIYEPNSLDNLNDTLLGLMGLPFGIFACWGFYTILKKQWNKKKEDSDNMILDEDFMN